MDGVCGVGGQYSSEWEDTTKASEVAPNEL